MIQNHLYKGADNISVSDFVKEKFPERPEGKEQMTDKDFLDLKPIPEDKSDKTYRPSPEVTNFESIVSQYTEEEKKEYEADIKAGTPPYIKPGTSLILDTDYMVVDIQDLFGSHSFLKQYDYSAFWNKNHEALLSDKYYKSWRPFKDRDEKGNFIGEKGKYVPFDCSLIPLNAKVWIYIRALDKVFNITPFLETVATDKTMALGAFTVNVSPMQLYETDKNNVVNFFGAMGIGGDNIYIENPIMYLGKYMMDFFENYVQPNDLLFIRYEELGMSGADGKEISEEAKNKQYQQGYLNGYFEVPKNKLSTEQGGTIWDMIGLVDNCVIQQNNASADKSISISGRDFTKLLMDDASYFIPLQYVQGDQDNWLFGGSTGDGVVKRNIITGDFSEYWLSYGFRKIVEISSFIINQLSNISIVPDDLFASFGNRRTKKYELIGNSRLKESDELVNGVWQIINLNVDKQLDERVLVDGSLSNSQGTLIEMLNRICQDPFVEIFGDTYTDQFDLVIRQPPFTKTDVYNVIDKELYISVSAGGVYDTSLSFDDRAYCMYQLQAQNALLGNEQFISLVYAPIVYFPKYADRFGMKRMLIPDIYLSCDATRSVSKERNEDAFRKAYVNDLLFAIETTVHLPFTRRGTITMNGDRRIKVGSYILFEGTGELFYVTGVNNSISLGQQLERITTLQVERGMFIDILKQNRYSLYRDETYNVTIGGTTQTIKNTKQETNFNYFSIANIDEMKKSMMKSENLKSKSGYVGIPNYGMNDQVFDWFINRKHMSYAWSQREKAVK